jgi:hypothetical protein
MKKASKLLGLFAGILVVSFALMGFVGIIMTIAKGTPSNYLAGALVIAIFEFIVSVSVLIFAIKKSDSIITICLLGVLAILMIIDLVAKFSNMYITFVSGALSMNGLVMVDLFKSMAMLKVFTVFAWLDFALVIVALTFKIIGKVIKK